MKPAPTFLDLQTARACRNLVVSAVQKYDQGDGETATRMMLMNAFRLHANEAGLAKALADLDAIVASPKDCAA